MSKKFRLFKNMKIQLPSGEYNGGAKLPDEEIEGVCALRHGFGKMFFSDKSSQYQSYEGEWKDNKMHGKGILMYENVEENEINTEFIPYKTRHSQNRRSKNRNDDEMGENSGGEIPIKYNGEFREGLYWGYGSMTYLSGKVEKGLFVSNENSNFLHRKFDPIKDSDKKEMYLKILKKVLDEKCFPSGLERVEESLHNDLPTNEDDLDMEDDIDDEELDAHVLKMKKQYEYERKLMREREEGILKRLEYEKEMEREKNMLKIVEGKSKPKKRRKRIETKEVKKTQKKEVLSEEDELLEKGSMKRSNYTPYILVVVLVVMFWLYQMFKMYFQ